MFSQAFQNAVKNGNAYSWTNATYDPAALDTIETVCNDHTGGWNLHIERVDFSADTATQFVIHLPAYATWAGTAVTGTNLNANSSNTAIATAKANETGQATRGSVVGGGSVLASGEVQTWLNVTLGYHKAIGVDAIADVAGAIATIWGYFSTT